PPPHNAAVPTLDHDALIHSLRQLQAAMRTALRAHMATQAPQVWSRTVRDDVGDTIFGIDAAVEEFLLEHCARWGARQHFTLIGEGLEPGGVQFGVPGRGGPPFRLLVDPIDGTRGLMFDKRSAFCLMGIAPDRGPATSLADIEVAVMTELPTTRQSVSDVLWAVRGRGVHGERHDLVTGGARPLPVVPSRATGLKHGFATVNAFFPGGKELTARIEEAILLRAAGPWNPDKAEIYSDQYICSGGQLAELALGRDRFVLDLRPLVHKRLGVGSSLCCRPYDLCTMLVAQEAGCVVCAPDGSPLASPLDTTTNVAFAGYANRALAELLMPIVREEVQRHLGA
ncbi:MAG TPA: inositol monophosphatase, partial [Planctomycetota bacterium]|nr:inositol monophosphatase [Planctomycetota bacterium]